MSGGRRDLGFAKLTIYRLESISQKITILLQGFKKFFLNFSVISPTLGVAGETEGE